MSSMSRNNSVNSLMGFSVHQPTLGSPLQFFPAMGSKQLDEMIDAYVPGDASILDKRAAVSMEFFEHTMATGDLFKFFMVYPTLGSTNTSPTMDSGYHSNFTTSPVMSESQWNYTSSRTTSPPSTKKTTSTNDFSHLPGMKIMTKDGRDVTNSASRGCKTKEQRDHAHLMRIIKACDSCRRKKTKCDPSHKRPAAGTSSGRVTKKASKNPRPAAAPPQTATNMASATDIEFDQIFSESSFDSFAESINVPTDGFSMEWDQFIQYDEEPTETIPYDYDFFLDPAGFFSPATTASFPSSSTSPSQLPITPIDRDVNIVDNTTEGHRGHKPILPYLNPGGLVEAGSNYMDFNLYSPESSFLDEDLDLAKEIAASPIQSQQLHRHRLKRTDVHQEAISNVAAVEVRNSAVYDDAICSHPRNVIPDAIRDDFFHDPHSYMIESSDSRAVPDATNRAGALDPQQANLAPDRQARPRVAAPVTPVSLTIVDNILETATSEGLYGRESIHEQAHLTPSSTDDRPQSPIVLHTAEYGTERQKDAHATSSRRGYIPSIKADPITQTDLSSRQLYVDRFYTRPKSSPYPRISKPVGLMRSAHDVVIGSGYGGSVASRMARLRSLAEDNVTSIVATSSLPTRVMNDGVTGVNDLHIAHSTAIANSPVRRVPRSSSSPLPSPVARTSDHVRSRIDETSSQGIVEANDHRTRIATLTNTTHVRGQQNGGSAVSWESGSETQYHIGVRQSFPALTGQLVFSDTLPATAVITGLGLFSLVVSRSSLRTTVAGCHSLVQSARPVVSSKVVRYTIVAFLLCTTLRVFSPLVFFLSMNALPIFAVYIKSQQPGSSPRANKQSSNLPPLHSLPNARRSRIEFINSPKAVCAEFMRVVRCDLARKLMSEIHPQTSSTIGLSDSKLSRNFERWGAKPLV
ncbi:hypothetical protein F5Y09DRAFT_188998 [Xylaria sp. FL1042]|nr:hypothetical protein F5Y09DRAFT_188998 [Xylaria sp. FL1042]